MPPAGSKVYESPKISRRLKLTFLISLFMVLAFTTVLLLKDELFSYDGPLFIIFWAGIVGCLFSASAMLVERREYGKAAAFDQNGSLWVKQKKNGEWSGPISIKDVISIKSVYGGKGNLPFMSVANTLVGYSNHSEQISGMTSRTVYIAYPIYGFKKSGKEFRGRLRQLLQGSNAEVDSSIQKILNR